MNKVTGFRTNMISRRGGCGDARRVRFAQNQVVRIVPCPENGRESVSAGVLRSFVRGADEAEEKRMRLVRARLEFRMILHADEKRTLPVSPDTRLETLYYPLGTSGRRRFRGLSF